MIRFACPCGRQLQARDEDAGKKAKCPKCGAISVVAPAESQAPAPEAPAATAHVPAPEAYDEAPLPEERVSGDRPMRVVGEDEEPVRGRRPRERDDYDDRPRKRGRRHVEGPAPSSGKAVAALVCGISSICLFVTAIPGVILGILALRDIGKSRGEMGGKGAAITGIILSCLAFFLLPVLLPFLLLPAVQRVRMAAQRTQDANNLKQIGLGLLNFQDVQDGLPQAAAYQDANGKPLLSWRVAILPYIEQGNLYKQFRLDEPWDSPNNKALIPLMPKTYAIPRDVTNTGAGLTYYQVFVGPGSAFEPNKNGRRPAGPQGPPCRGWRLRDFPDGTSNTGLVFTAQSPVIWTKPDDLTFDPQGPLPPLGGHMSSGMNIAFADGSVKFIPGPQNDSLLRAIITRNGNEIVTLP